MRARIKAIKAGATVQRIVGKALREVAVAGSQAITALERCLGGGRNRDHGSIRGAAATVSGPFTHVTLLK